MLKKMMKLQINYDAWNKACREMFPTDKNSRNIFNYEKICFGSIFSFSFLRNQIT